MKFTLTFDGELPSSGNKGKKEAKWLIRKEFHPQLMELWQTHAAMKGLLKRGIYVPKAGSFMIEQIHHKTDQEGHGFPDWSKDPNRWNLVEFKEYKGRKYQPLVRDSLALSCSLNVLFLRKEEPGSLVLQGGDIDGRMKTLLDALRMPNTPEELVDDPTIPDPCFCLLESDTLITGITIKTDRLLSRPNSSVHEVHLVIEVDVAATEATLYNMQFLGT